VAVVVGRVEASCSVRQIRTMAATARLNRELKAKMAKVKKTATDPVEMLRASCLERGASGIKGLGRYASLDISINSVAFLLNAVCSDVSVIRIHCIIFSDIM